MSRAHPESRLTSVWHRRFYIAALMLAGESIYMLPYMRKTFQTSMEAVFGLGATQIGLLNTMFGILALVCYFPGGWLADHFTARRLLTFSLMATGLGGLVLLARPEFAGLLALHAFWGVTSILTFWAALIKATRYWGGARTQGTSFGLLDGGRGVVGALLASLATAVFALGQTPGEGLEAVIVVYAVAPMIAGVVVWFVIPDHLDEPDEKEAVSNTASTALERVRTTLRLSCLWLMAVVILAAYLLFIGSYEFPAFAERGFGRDKVFGATLGTFRDWMRPVAAIGAGLLADRFITTRVVAAAFILLAVGYGSLFAMPTDSDLLWLLWSQVALVAISVFALRGIYFALLKQMQIPMSLTGTAVGFVSLVGFAPDVFGHVLAGWFVESHGGSVGYQHYFGFLSLVALIGLFASLAIHWRTRDTASATT